MKTIVFLVLVVGIILGVGYVVTRRFDEEEGEYEVTNPAFDSTKTKNTLIVKPREESLRIEDPLMSDLANSIVLNELLDQNREEIAQPVIIDETCTDYDNTPIDLESSNVCTDYDSGSNTYDSGNSNTYDSGSSCGGGDPGF